MEAQTACDGRNVLLLAGAGAVATHFIEGMFPTMAVALARQSGATLQLVLGWSILGYLLFGLAALPAHWLAERVGGRLLLLVALFGLGVAALASSEAPSGRALTVCLAMLGAFAGLCHPVGRSLLPRQDGAQRLARWCSGAGLVAAPVLTAALCERVGWQPAYRIVGYALCAIAVACAFLPVDESLPERRRALPRSVTPSPWRPRLVLLLGIATAAVTFRGITLIQPAYFAARVSELGYGIATSIAYALALIGDVVVRRLARRRAAPRLYFVLHAASLPLLLLMTALGGSALVGVTALFLSLSVAASVVEQPLFAALDWPRGVSFAGVKAIATAGGALAVSLVTWAIGFAGLPYALVSLAGVAGLSVAAAALLTAIDRNAHARVAAPVLRPFQSLEERGREGVPP